VKSQTSFLTVQDGLYSLSRHSRATKLCYWGLRVFSQDKAWYTVLRGSYYFANSATTPSRPRPRRRTSGPRTYIPCGINYIIRVILVIGKVTYLKCEKSPARACGGSAGHNFVYAKNVTCALQPRIEPYTRTLTIHSGKVTVLVPARRARCPAILASTRPVVRDTLRFSRI
jgi:hypothetical protein